MKPFLYIFVFFISLNFYAQNVIEQDLVISDYVEGTLLIPNQKTETIIIIIPGSGPTDRDGNQNFSKNNSLKYLAQDLTAAGFATFRYDKRALTMLKKGANVSEISKVNFDNFVEDAKRVVSYFNKNKRYQNIYIIGHSQGSLVGMLAADKNVTGFVSLAGAGNSIDNVIMEQLKGMSVQQSMLNEAKKTLDILKGGKIDKDFNPNLANIFNLEIQPFMMSWIAHDPVQIFSQLNIKTLIVNGTRDLQVSVAEAKLLSDAKKEANYIIIDDMNHVLKTISTTDSQENMKLYNMPNAKNHADLAKAIINFINN